MSLPNRTNQRKSCMTRPFAGWPRTGESVAPRGCQGVGVDLEVPRALCGRTCRCEHGAGCAAPWSAANKPGGEVI